MKKQLLFIASLFTAFSLSAQQLENPGFESWETDEDGIEVPTGNWFTFSFCLEFGDLKECAVYLSKTEGVTGYGAKIQAEDHGDGPSAMPLFYDNALSSKPTKMTFYYKSTKPLTAGIIVTKGEPLNVDELTDATGYGQSILAPVSSFTKVEIPLTYNNDDATDSVGVVFTLGEQELTTDDYFVIDDVSLSYGVAGLSEKQMAQIIGSNIVTSSLNLKETVEELNVYNTSGTQVFNASNTQTADFSTLPEGLYMVTLKKGNSMGTMKVIKK
ncbi:T9SS type A sorting domain-containing protein [Sporocytophaga myxococcoides]|uniref:T9SS type A sorting domain-containing protein n=1 Tax=Sporocytophaga myxococcoides TaxID=153721 RepID=UPI0003F6A13D|nr:T9SS type A sorting domain-containing protein [Sporocytophaga myxococcoides]